MTADGMPPASGSDAVERAAIRQAFEAFGITVAT